MGKKKKPSPGLWIEKDEDGYSYIFENPTELSSKHSIFDFHGELLWTDNPTYIEYINDKNPLDYESKRSRKLKKLEIVKFKLLGKL